MSFSSKSGPTVRKRHILFIQYYFPPMGGGGVQRIIKFLKYLDYQQYQVTLLTVKPSFFYSFDETLEAEIPPEVVVLRSGSLDPFRITYLIKTGLAKLGLSVSLPTTSPENSQPQTESGSTLRRWAASLFVPDSRLPWLPFAFSALWRAHSRKPFEMVIASMPPFTTGLIGALARRFLKIPLVLDFRDAWINNPYLPAKGKIQEALSRRLEGYCIRQSDKTIFINPSLAKDYFRRYPALANKQTITIRNGYDQADFEDLAEQPLSPPPRPFTLGIMGTIYSEGNRPTTLLEGFSSLVKANKHIDFRIQILGKWTPEFPEVLANLGIKDKVELIPYRPHREALAFANTHFDALALAIESGRKGSKAVVPGRIYEYLRLGKPILVTCPLDGDLAGLVRDNCAGEVVAYEDVEKIEKVLRQWWEKRDTLKALYPGRDLSGFDRQKQTEGLMAFLEQNIPGEHKSIDKS